MSLLSILINLLQKKLFSNLKYSQCM